MWVFKPRNIWKYLAGWCSKVLTVRDFDVVAVFSSLSSLGSGSFPDLSFGCRLGFDWLEFGGSGWLTVSDFYVVTALSSPSLGYRSFFDFSFRNRLGFSRPEFESWLADWQTVSASTWWQVSVRFHILVVSTSFTLVSVLVWQAGVRWFWLTKWMWVTSTWWQLSLRLLWAVAVSLTLVTVVVLVWQAGVLELPSPSLAALVTSLRHVHALFTCLGDG